MFGLNFDNNIVDDGLKYYALKTKGVLQTTGSNGSKSHVDISHEDDEIVVVHVEPASWFYAIKHINNTFRLVVHNPNASVFYYIFTPKMQPKGEYGIEYYNEQGEIVYSSNHSYLRIAGKVSLSFDRKTMVEPRITSLSKQLHQKMGFILGSQFLIERQFGSSKKRTYEVPAVKIDDNSARVANLFYSSTIGSSTVYDAGQLVYLTDFFFADLTGI